MVNYLYLVHGLYPNPSKMNNSTSLQILYADNDIDDCEFFSDALKELDMDVRLIMVHDGEQLMLQLERVSANLPFALFLDLNMPLKDGIECLTEIKNHATLKNLPVIIYSTSYNEEIADQLYDLGAAYFICKPSEFEDIKFVIHKAIMLLGLNKVQPKKEDFYINELNTAM